MPVRAPRFSRPSGDRRRVAAVLRWPIGIAVVSWQYLWRTTAIRRVDEEGDASDLPDPVPPDRLDDRIQQVQDGYGPLLHRRYRVRIVDGCPAEELMARLAADPNRWAPSGMSVFRRTRGESGSMSVGDELVVRLPGPWDGPVRVITSGPRGFRLATLRGHLEAGQIEFRVRPDGAAVDFEIESWARPGDRLSHVLYNRLLLAKEVQLVMWTQSCLGVAALSGGRRDGPLSVHTRRLTDPG
ncbi:DUF1990 family protein [Pseudonocardia oroxyli]|uniref:DUF1990 domain-containing protein n=1 Tax=Pseudonocardia oroxyli TaxID=366584 RepID=A0A1G7G7Y5_PSEOR|nr:DUF1990 family protein [Pseudonocardia oroxyli]SDE84207.1 protein of unknown function [Pseudonocardia oroxyli]